MLLMLLLFITLYLVSTLSSNDSFFIVGNITDNNTHAH